MAFEIELLNERFDVPEEAIWHVINLYWTVTQQAPHLSAFALAGQHVDDMRRTLEWHGEYDGIKLEISFPRDGDKLIWLGVTHVGDSPFSRYEHLLGYIEVRRARINFDTPVDVRIVCAWKPFYLFFKEMADTILSHY